MSKNEFEGETSADCFKSWPYHALQPSSWQATSRDNGLNRATCRQLSFLSVSYEVGCRLDTLFVALAGNTTLLGRRYSEVLVYVGRKGSAFLDFHILAMLNEADGAKKHR